MRMSFAAPALVLCGLLVLVLPTAAKVDAPDTVHWTAAEKARLPRCQLVREPVCGIVPSGARKTIVNACAAVWQKAKVLHSGECQAPGKEPMMCSMIYKPVCAADSATRAEKTYPSLCSAEVASAKLLHDGQCKTPNPGK